MDPIDLDFLITQIWSGDETASGYVPQPGEHVFCYRPSDGAIHCGTVDDNRGGLFLSTCTRGRHVLTAANWLVQPTPVSASCLAAPA